MTYSVGTLWAIYVVVVIISFLIFWLLLGATQRYYRSVSYGTAFFLATILGAVAVFVGAAWLDPNQLSSTDKTWLSVLFLIAFLLPVFVILYIVWAGEYASVTGEDDCLPSWCRKDKCKNPCESSCYETEPERSYVKQTIHCDQDTGICHIKEKTIYQGDNITKVTYSSHKGNKAVNLSESIIE
ncbi:Hypothetical protein HVR_LOCUS774 [uncultured virus]|nr:Hypothetical protein HVR_LOCUS774 [uncultured virus]